MPILTAEERIGTKIAEKYRVDRILGRGGFGVVFAGVHEWTGREIAVKVLNHDLGTQDQFVRRFLQEARAAASLKHDSVVDVLDMGQEPDGTVYLVLELLEGEDLSARIEREAPMRPTAVLDILIPVMDALAQAHKQGIVHRDLKPDNIYLSVDSKGRMVPKLLDFGIAKMADSGLTSTGMVVGTPHYMAPEQARGLPDIGPAADVWSMAIVMWQCLTKNVPFDAGTPTGVLAEILTKRPPSFGQVVPNLHGPLSGVIDRGLRHEVDQRYPDMGTFLSDVIRAANEMGLLPPAAAHIHTQPEGSPPPNMPSAPPPSMPTPTPNKTTPLSWSSEVPAPTPRRGGALLVAGAVAGLLLLGGGVFGAVALWPSEGEPTDARPAAAPSPVVDPETPPITAPASAGEADVAGAEGASPTDEGTPELDGDGEPTDRAARGDEDGALADADETAEDGAPTPSESDGPNADNAEAQAAAERAQRARLRAARQRAAQQARSRSIEPRPLGGSTTPRRAPPGANTRVGANDAPIIR